MKTLNYLLLPILLFFFESCAEDRITISNNLTNPQYTLPKGESNSVDERIYNIHEKYGTYILYSFDRNDFTNLWTAKWRKWYAPANTNNNLAYVDRFITFINENIFTKYEPDFIRKNFPYKVFLVDTLCDNITYSKSRQVSILSNGNNAIAISNVGKVSDKWTDTEWKQLAVDLNNAFSIYYYSSLEKKPLKFLSLRSKDISILSDPLNIDAKYEYSCRTAGYVSGWLKAYIPPKEEQDFADFIRLLTGTAGRELMQIFNRYTLLKDRARALYGYMKSNMNMDMIATQNMNFPDDKFPIDYFLNN